MLEPTAGPAAARWPGRRHSCCWWRAGLTASGIAVTSILRHSLISRVDQTLLEASRGWALAPERRAAGYRCRRPDRPPSNFYVRSIDSDGRAWTVVNDRNARTRPAGEQRRRVRRRGLSARSIIQQCSGGRCRCAGPTRRLITVAYDLSDIQQTVRSLAWLQFGIGAAVLLVLGLAG